MGVGEEGHRGAPWGTLFPRSGVWYCLFFISWRSKYCLNRQLLPLRSYPSAGSLPLACPHFGFVLFRGRYGFQGRFPICAILMVRWFCYLNTVRRPLQLLRDELDGELPPCVCVIGRPCELIVCVDGLDEGRCAGFFVSFSSTNVRVPVVSSSSLSTSDSCPDF